MARFVRSYAGVGDVMRSPQVRAALRARAATIAARANGEDPELSAYVQEGTRPKGRPFARAVSDDGAEREFGSSRTERRRTLGRAAGI